jgi:hypothetical protein
MTLKATTVIVPLHAGPVQPRCVVVKHKIAYELVRRMG